MKNLQLWWYFFRLGLTGFGGPLAIIAQLQIDLVDRKKLVDEEEFKKSLALIKSLPGPTATQVLTFNAYRIGGFWFSIVSLVLFVLPAFFMMVLLAIYYDQFRTDPQIMILLEGMQTGALILIVMALYSLSKGHLKQSRFWLLFIASLVLLGPLKVFEPVVIIGSGLVGLFLKDVVFQKNKINSWPPLDLFLICLKAGGLAFGTGFAILPLLQTDFVELHRWVSKEQFMDAIAFGQLTPGPVSVTVTFVGYRIAGWLGAVIATTAIFLPGAFNMTTWFPRAFHWFASQKWVKSFVVGATAAIAAGIVLAVLSLSETTKILSLIIPVVLLVAGTKIKIPSWALVVVSGVGWWAFKNTLHF